MYYAIILYTDWLIRLFGDSEEVHRIIASGSHAVIAYERQVREKDRFKKCYFSVAYTPKGVQHIMSLHNEWQDLIDHYNEYAYFPIEKRENIDGMLASLDENGDFILIN